LFISKLRVDDDQRTWIREENSVIALCPWRDKNIVCSRKNMQQKAKVPLTLEKTETLTAAYDGTG